MGILREENGYFTWRKWVFYVKKMGTLREENGYLREENGYFTWRKWVFYVKKMVTLS